MTVDEAVRKYDVFMGSSALRRMAQENLMPGEDVMYAVNVMCVKENGKQEALLVITESRIMCCSRKLVARELVEFPYLNIQTMEIKGGLFNKELHIKSLSQTIIISATLHALNNIKNVLQGLIAYDLQAAQGAWQNQREAPPQENEAVDMESQIRSLKRLLDDGLITEEEYEIKRRQVLGI